MKMWSYKWKQKNWSITNIPTAKKSETVTSEQEEKPQEIQSSMRITGCLG